MADLNLYDSPFNNFVQRTYQPQNMQGRLQTAYNQAMKNKPAQWGYMISDMMPSIAEIVASQTTKGAFNQGRIVDALEREKGRRIAYNQMMRENDDKQANDYVQMAKEQLGFDMALDDRERAKLEAQRKADMELDRIKEEQRRYEEAKEERERQQAIQNKWREIEDINRREAAEQARIQQEFQNDRTTKNDLLDRAYKQAQTDKINRENSPEYLKQQQEQKQKEADDKAKEEEIKAIKQEIKSFNDKGSIDTGTYLLINNNPELRKYLKPKENAAGGINIFGTTVRRSNPNTYELDYAQIIRDKTGKEPTKQDIKAFKKDLGVE